MLDTQHTLKAYRQSIDNLDAALIHILAERFRLTLAVGQLKAERGLPSSDPVREKEQMERMRKLAEEAQLDPEFSEEFLRFVLDEVIRSHDRLRREFEQASATGAA